MEARIEELGDLIDQVGAENKLHRLTEIVTKAINGNLYGNTFKQALLDDLKNFKKWGIETYDQIPTFLYKFSPNARNLVDERDKVFFRGILRVVEDSLHHFWQSGEIGLTKYEIGNLYLCGFR